MLGMRALVGHDKKVGRHSTEIRGGGKGNLREVEMPCSSGYKYGIE